MDPINEDEIDEDTRMVYATRTPPDKNTYGPNRQGTKKVKSMERLASSGYELAPKEATMFRALAARANFWPKTVRTLRLRIRNRKDNFQFQIATPLAN